MVCIHFLPTLNLNFQYCSERNCISKSPHEKIKLKGASPLKENQGTNAGQQKRLKPTHYF